MSIVFVSTAASIFYDTDFFLTWGRFVFSTTMRRIILFIYSDFRNVKIPKLGYKSCRSLVGYEEQKIEKLANMTKSGQFWVDCCRGYGLASWIDCCRDCGSSSIVIYHLPIVCLNIQSQTPPWLANKRSRAMQLSPTAHANELRLISIPSRD